MRLMSSGIDIAMAGSVSRSSRSILRMTSAKPGRAYSLRCSSYDSATARGRLRIVDGPLGKNSPMARCGGTLFAVCMIAAVVEVNMSLILAPDANDVSQARQVAQHIGDSPHQVD